MVQNCDEQIQLNKFNSAEDYAPNLGCHIVFRVNIDQQIKLRFGIFNVENSSNCQKDYVELRDCGGHLANIIGRFCGQDQPASLYSSRHTLFLQFVTDSQDNASVLDLSLDAVPRFCGVPEIQLKSDGLKEVTMGIPMKVLGWDYGIGCFWKVLGDSPMVVHFVNFNLQGPDANGSCVAEYLQIYSKEVRIT